MDILLIADTHDNLTIKELKSLFQDKIPDCTLLLGDIGIRELKIIKECTQNKNLYGVVGNHDDKHILKAAEIKDLHLKTVRVGDYTIGGYGGSIKYKDNPNILLHQVAGQEALTSKRSESRGGMSDSAV